MSAQTSPAPPAGASFTELCEVMRRLLAPDGCPWDREQTLDTLRPFLLEETYEVLDAIERGGPDDHCEELGDLLMQVVFHALLRRAEGAFDIDDVCRGITEKLVRRHPHVFGDASAETSKEVLEQWDQIKAREKADKAGDDAPAPRILDGVPIALPPLARAQKLGKRAAKVGFDWPDIGGPRGKIDEEAGELDDAIASGDTVRIEAELGDLLFATVNLARKLGIDADTALRSANHRFEERFRYIEDRLGGEGRAFRDCDLAELDRLWEAAKGVRDR